MSISLRSPEEWGRIRPLRPVRSCTGPSPPGVLALIILASVGGPGYVAGQQAGLQGIVTDAETGSALESATVVLEGVEGGVHTAGTDRNGYYQIAGIEPGPYVLRIELLGYAPFESPVTFTPDQFATASARLDPQPVTLEDLEVVAPRAGAVLRDLGRQRVTPADLGRMPVPSASGDLASYLQTLPGVVATGDRGGHLFVRGGSHTSNLTLVDGLPIYQPFHIVGFFSAFPEDLVASADFYAGGFGPHYSGRTSAVLDVRMRDGSREEVQATGSVSPFLAEVVAEGPADREGHWSWLASARQSLIEETSPTVLGQPHPLKFESQFAKLGFLTEDNGRCSAILMRTSDRGRMDPEDPVSRVSWENLVYGGRCVLPYERTKRLIDANIGISIVRNAAVNRDAADFASDIRHFQVEVSTTDLAWGVPYEFGVSVSIDEMDYDLTELFGQQSSDEVLYVWKSYAEADLALSDRIRLRPGAVVHLTQPMFGVEPRLRGSWQPWGSGNGELTAAVGLYRQALVGISDTRDASSVFVAWKRAADDVPEEALHAMLGWQQSLGGGLHWSVEGYYKRLRNVSVPVWNNTADFDTELALAKGRVYGADLRVEYDRPPFYGFAGYGWSWTEYESQQESFSVWFGEPFQRYHPPHDRRHQVNAMLSLDLGAFEAAARWQLGTGLPFTRPIGFDEAFDFRRTTFPVHSRPGITRLIIERPYLGRLPSTHRLDVSITGTVDLPFGELRAQAGAVNLYDRANIFFYDVYTRRRLDQLPVAPYLSLRLAVP